ncbi:MAG: sigma-54 dependent transcriptional regulator [Myxococcota bacterium]
MPASILVVDDDAAFGTVLASLLRQAGYQATSVTSAQEGLVRLERTLFDLLITDLLMPGMNGTELLRATQAKFPDIPVLMASGHATVREATQAIRQGAVDFIEKPIDRDQLLQMVEKALARRPPLAAEPPLEAPDIGLPRPQLEDLARSDAPVLILGETGTGKSRLAGLLHEASRRAKGPFVTLDCGTLPEGLAESEIFGHVKGAFTGAAGSRDGAARRADKGTLFLDEIGDLLGPLQIKLLRLVQEGEVRPVGSDHPASVDLRIIAATKRDLEADVQQGRFRDDLYYRLAVVPLVLPPLRGRHAHIGNVASARCEAHAERLGRSRVLSSGALEALQAHDWPGNYRELDNVLARLVLMSRDENIVEEDVRRWLRPGRPASSPSPAPVGSVREEENGLEQARRASERQAIRDALRLSGGNRTRAAKMLDIGRRTLYRKLSELFDEGELETLS